MKFTPKTNRLYNDLAWLWPLWGTLEEYREESEAFISLIRTFARTEVRSLLDVGCGSGKHTFHFKKQFEVTGVDISEPMLAQARKLNPECAFHLGDMRTLDLNRTFDAVFMNDPIAYMTTKEDLLAAFQTAYRHLHPGGVMLAFAEYVKERFKQNATAVSTIKKPGLDVAIMENNYDPNPHDDTFETTFVYLIRNAGVLTIEHDLHTIGLFSLDTWRGLLKRVGFEVNEQLVHLSDTELTVFTCVKPL